MKVIKAPEPVTGYAPFIFLAGSIDQGKAVNWQEQIEQALTGYDNLTVLNPRRDDWNPDWVELITNPQFKEQVTWEMDCLDRANLVVVYFDPEQKSPITLLELGYCSQMKQMIVCCPDGYWKKGNVQVVCERNNIPLTNNINEFIGAIKLWCNEHDA